MEVSPSSGIATSIVKRVANEKGEYVSPELMPAGTWTMSAMAPPTWKPPEPRDEQRLGWAQTFYPNVTDPELAVKLEVPPGAEFSDLDIELAAAPVYCIRGVLLNVHGHPVPKASVELGMTGMGGLPISSETRQDTDADGAFEFESVVDGEFRLSSTVDRDGVKQRASESVQVKGRDLENVKLQLTLPFSIEEKILMEVPEGATAPELPTVEMISAEQGVGVPRGVPDGKGGFTVKNLYPGVYKVVSILHPAPYYLDSIRLGGIDVPPSGVQILSDAQPLVLTYSGGTVRGTVDGCSDGYVFLVKRAAIPEARRPVGPRRHAPRGSGRLPGGALRQDGPLSRCVRLAPANGGGFVTVSNSDGTEAIASFAESLQSAPGSTGGSSRLFAHRVLERS
jgi:hypothetical protein